MAYPGAVSKLAQGATLASTTSMTVTSDVHIVSGTVAVETIKAPAVGGFSARVTLIPTGAFTTVTTGNVAIASTAVVGKALIMTFVKSTAKWYPSY